MIKDEALKLALEALECALSDDRPYIVQCKEAIAAIEQALAQPEQEPVAWSYWQSCLNDDGTQTAPWVPRLCKFKPTESIINKDVTPLYTTPPQQEPVCPDCKAKVLYECVACSSNNYPPKSEQKLIGTVGDLFDDRVIAHRKLDRDLLVYTASP